MAKIVKISGSGRKSIVQENLTAEAARELANRMAKAQPAGGSSQYRVAADGTAARDVR